MNEIDAATEARVDWRRVLLFVALAYGIAGVFALIVYATGGLEGSPEVIPGSGLTLALVLIATGYMWAPALAHLLTRLLTREGWQGLRLRPRLRRGWPYWMAAWILPLVLTAAGAVLFFVLFPQYYDPGMGRVDALLEGQPVPDWLRDPWVFVLLQAGQALFIAPVVNGLFAFGEEFGWRAYLQPHLMPLGWRRAMGIVNVIWGLWHAPVIAMGYNYGTGYPGEPWTGFLMMAWVALSYGVVLGWLTWRGGSVWPAVIGHGAINGIAGLAGLFVQGEPSVFLGPLPLGLVGAAAWTLVALWLFFFPGRPVRAAGPDAPPAP